LTQARYLRAHTIKHGLNETINQIDPKSTNKLLKQTGSLR
jgi:hypothetical protein